VKFVRSSGTDEAAQRSALVAVEALKPFAAVDLLSSGLLTLEAELANAKIVTFGTATTAKAALAQAPYRWGSSDGQANAMNAARCSADNSRAERQRSPATRSSDGPESSARSRPTSSTSQGSRAT
jgi:hypothetical protein